MKSTLLFLAVCAVVLGIGGTTAKAQEPSIKIAVVGLTNPSTLRKSNIGNALVDILDSEISEAGKYTLLERAELDELKKELNLGGSDLADAKSFAQKGGLAGADFLLLGKVSEYTYKENGVYHNRYEAGRMVQVLFYDQVASVRVDIRIVDVKTGEDVRSVAGHGTSHNTGIVSFQAEWNSYVQSEGAVTLSNLRTLLTEASNAAIRNAVDQLNDMYGDLVAFRSNRAIGANLASIGGGKILADIGNGQYVIGFQSTSGLKVGDRFQVTSEIPIRNSKGVVVYSEKHNAGTLQIMDISEANRAMARLVNAGDSGIKPKENDGVTFDEQYGKSLRGMPSPSSSSAISSSGASAQPDVRNYIEKGDRFMSNQEYSEALAQYRSGLQFAPNNAELLSRKSMAEEEVNDFTDAEEDAEKSIDAGGIVGFPIYHQHSFNYCIGTLMIQKGKVSFQPKSGDHGFTVTSKAQITVAGTLVNRTLPGLSIRWQGPDKKEHKYNIAITMFMTQAPRAGLLSAASPFQAEGNAGDQTNHLNRIVLELIDKSLN